MEKIFLIDSSAGILNASPEELTAKVIENFGRRAEFSGPINPYGHAFVNNDGPQTYVINHKKFKASVRIYPHSGKNQDANHSGKQPLRYCGVYVSSGDADSDLRILYAVADVFLFDGIQQSFGVGIKVRPLEDKQPEAYLLHDGSLNTSFPNSAIPLGLYAVSLEDIAMFHKAIREGKKI